MTREELNQKYFEWIYRLVYNEQYLKETSYYKLLNHLHNTEFVYIMGMDGNRAEDGIDLRYRFGYEQKHIEPMVATYLDDRSCSVLEMLTALSMRCEEHIMDDPDIGNRTGEWFWNMMENLELSSMNDSKFDVGYIDNIVSKFLNRQYKRNGEGGLFTVKHRECDLRSVEIWYQMCWYLDDIL